MVANIKIPYRMTEIDPTEYSKLRTIIPKLREDQKQCYYDNKILVELDTIIPEFARLEMPIEISEIVTGQDMFVKLQDQVDSCQMQISEMYQSGKAVIVHVPNLGLLSITEVTHIDDACTDTLQDMLNTGWRILAVCPPNAQRRPDYILGRSKL